MFGEAMGAAVVLVLCGLIFPISMLVGALLFDALLAAWVLVKTWHEEWQPTMTRSIRRMLDGGGVRVAHRG